MKNISCEWLYNFETIDMIVLNTPHIELIYERFYPRAENVIVTDGASNYVRAFLESSKKTLLPTQIVGDLDSISQDSRDFFRDVEIVCDTNPELTDLEKALALTTNQHVLIVGELTGRTDHLFRVFHCLCQYYYRNKTVWFLGNENLIFPLKGNSSVDLYSLSEWTHYGLVPVDGRSVVSTAGFKWNLSNEVMELGGLVSTSNEVLQQTVFVDSTELVLLICSK